MKKILFIIALTTLTSPAWAINYFDNKENCFAKSDIKLIEEDFPQLKGVSETMNQEIICVGSESSDVLIILKSLLALKSFNLESVVASKTQDDLALKVIKDKNWWKYFTDRAKYFVARPEYCQSDKSVVAFVRQRERDVINLCDSFFQADVVTQVSVLMHEVRHFDGYGHVECTQGLQKGVVGACDVNIKDTGSYAISTQVYVELAKSKQISHSDKIVAEMMAVVTVNNKFNVKANVKASDYVYLSNTQGELYRGVTTKLAKLEKVGKLSSPGKVYSNSDTLTLLPLDSSLNVSRFYRDLKKNSPSVGLFGDMFNKENQEQKKLYTDFNYYGAAGFIKDSTFYNACGIENTTITPKYLKNVKLKSILNLKNSENEYETYVLSESGAAYLVKCKDDKDEAIITQANFKFPKDTVSGFSTKSENALILNETGEVLDYNLRTKVSSPTGIQSRDWLSITPHKIYEIFNENAE